MINIFKSDFTTKEGLQFDWTLQVYNRRLWNIFSKKTACPCIWKNTKSLSGSDVRKCVFAKNEFKSPQAMKTCFICLDIDVKLWSFARFFGSIDSSIFFPWGEWGARQKDESFYLWRACLVRRRKFSYICLQWNTLSAAYFCAVSIKRIGSHGS